MYEIRPRGDHVIWTCRQDRHHRWTQTVTARLRTTVCPYCELEAQLAAEDERFSTLHPTRNRPDTEAKLDSGARIWWRCDVGGEGHDWRDTFIRRVVHGLGCPACGDRPHPEEAPTLRVAHPDLAAQLDPALNDGVTADMVPATSSERLVWRCAAGPDHIWPTKLNKRTRRGQGCPFCSGNRVSITNSLATLEPAIAAQLDPALNDGITAHDVTRSANRMMTWRCDAGPDHVWPAKIANRTGPNRTGCPCCNGQRPSVTNTVAALHPVLAAELAPDLDDGPPADQTVAGSETVRMWRCATEPTHTWPARVSQRTRVRSGCPHCVLANQSEVEVRVCHELAAVVGFDPGDHRVEGLDPRSTVDMIWRARSVVVEYDGRYWHRDKAEQDTAKSRRLEKLGWTVVRLREAPLERLGPHDVVVPSGDWLAAAKLAGAALATLDQLTAGERALLASYASAAGAAGEESAEATLATLRSRRGEKRPEKRPARRRRTGRAPATVSGSRTPFWMSRFRTYVDENGHGLVPAEYRCADGSRLGQWVSTVRYGSNRVTTDEREELDRLGFIWDARAHARSAWIDRFEAFVAEYGHGEVPAGYHCADGAHLGSWVRKVRSGRTKLSDAERARLEAAGFGSDARAALAPPVSPTSGVRVRAS